MPEPGGPGGPLPPPQYLADQLTLFQPWGADSVHPLLEAPPMFFHLPASLRMYSVSHWYYPVYIMARERKMQYCWDNNYRTPCTYRRGLSWTMESFGYLVLIWFCWPHISANPTYRLINLEYFYDMYYVLIALVSPDLSVTIFC